MPTRVVEVNVDGWTEVVAAGIQKFTAQAQPALGRRVTHLVFRFEASAPPDAEDWGLRYTGEQAATRDHGTGALYARGSGVVVVAE